MFLLRPLNAGRRLFPRKRHADGFGTFAIKSTEKAATMSRVFCTFFPQKVLIAVCDWCCLPLFGRRLTAVFARGVLCTFWPQKVQKTPRQMPPPTSSRLTLAPGDYSRGRTRPVPFARAFSRAFVSRLRHRAGIVRGETRRGGGVRDKQKAQKPTIAPGSGFKPPHSRLQWRKHRM